MGRKSHNAVWTLVWGMVAPLRYCEPLSEGSLPSEARKRGGVWKQIIKGYPELRAKGIHAGSGNFRAPAVTAGGVVFIAATRDEKIRAFYKTTGELLWEASLPAAGIATPAVYPVNGK